jgi:hypothetical protein
MARSRRGRRLSRYLTTLEVAMNAFYKHHQDNIRFNYRCFDRILLNGVIQPFQQPERSASSTPIASCTRSAGTFCVTSLGSFRTGSRIARKDGVHQFWKLSRQTRRLRRALLSKSKAGPNRQGRSPRLVSDRYTESAGTGAHPDCHRKQEGQPLASPKIHSLRVGSSGASCKPAK